MADDDTSIDGMRAQMRDLSAMETALNSKLMAVRGAKNALRQGIFHCSEDDRVVSDPAVLRYLERHKGIDVEALRIELRALARDAIPAKDCEHYVHPTGVIMVLGEAGRIVTVLSPEQAAKWDGRKLKNGATMHIGVDALCAQTAS